MNNLRPSEYPAPRTEPGTGLDLVAAYPHCQRGEPQGYAHRFHPAVGLDEFTREAPLLFCELCGRVRKLRIEPYESSLGGG